MYFQGCQKYISDVAHPDIAGVLAASQWNFVLTSVELSHNKGHCAMKSEPPYNEIK